MGGDALLLGIDVGTTGVKAVLFDQEGHSASSGEAQYPLSCPRPGWAEQDPQDWWEAVRQAVRQACTGTEAGASRVASVAVSSQAPTMLAVARGGSPLRPALIWMDRRAEAEAQKIQEALGASFILKTTGNRADPFYVAPKIAWFRLHEPELFSRTHLFIQANGYIGWKLTGCYGMDNVHAALLQLRERATGSWSPALCKACGVEPALFPPVLAGHAHLGEVTAKASQETGLRRGTPVVAGTVDGAAAAVECGAVAPGLAAEMTGASTVLLMAGDTPLTEPAFIAMPHALPGLHLLLGAISSSGASLRWFRDQVAGGTAIGYDELTSEAAAVPPGGGGIFLPYMMGERSPLWNTNARGVLLGLSLSTTRGALVRSILEGTCFALRHNLEVARNAGLVVTGIRSVGGGTKSELWNQMKADVLGVPVHVPQVSCGAPFGDAVLAGMGLGLYRDPRAAIARMIADRARYEPDPAKQETYGELYRIYRATYEGLKDLFPAVVRVTDNPWPEIPPNASMKG